MLNKLTIIGRVGQEPKPIDKNGEIFVVQFSVAATEKWKDKAGQKQEHTEWFNVKVFGKLMDVVLDYVRKGDLIYLEGKLKSSEYVDDQGLKRKNSDLIVSTLKMLSTPKTRVESSTDAKGESVAAEKTPKPSHDGFENDEIPF